MDYLAVKGNHDADGWDGVRWLWNGDPDGYAAQLRPTLPAGADCRGEYGTAMVCDYRGVTLVLSDVGVDAAGESANARQYEHIDRALRESSNPWKVCVWHMNMEDMQVSYKGDSVGWGAFEICRRRGAFVVNGHAHSYARTKEMARYGRKVYGHTKKELVVSHPGIDRVYLSSGENGTNGVAVVGFGGYKNEPQLRGATTGRRFTRASVSGRRRVRARAEARKFGARCAISRTRDRARRRSAGRSPPSRRTPRARRRDARTGTRRIVFSSSPELGRSARRGVSQRRRNREPAARSTATSNARIPTAWTCNRRHTTARDRKNGEMRLVVHDRRRVLRENGGRCVELYPGGLRDYDDYADPDPDADPPEADAIGNDPMDDVDFKALADDVLRSIGGD